MRYCKEVEKRIYLGHSEHGKAFRTLEIQHLLKLAIQDLFAVRISNLKSFHCSQGVIFGSMPAAEIFRYSTKHSTSFVFE